VQELNEKGIGKKGAKLKKKNHEKRARMTEEIRYRIHNMW